MLSISSINIRGGEQFGKLRLVGRYVIHSTRRERMTAERDKFYVCYSLSLHSLIDLRYAWQTWTHCIIKVFPFIKPNFSDSRSIFQHDVRHAAGESVWAFVAENVADMRAWRYFKNSMAHPYLDIFFCLFVQNYLNIIIIFSIHVHCQISDRLSHVSGELIQFVNSIDRNQSLLLLHRKRELVKSPSEKIYLHENSFPDSRHLIFPDERKNMRKTWSDEI